LSGSLTVYTPPGEAWNQYDSITAFTFDGKQLWSVDWTGGVYELLRIEIPWVD
jgi:hypothetical protein